MGLNIYGIEGTSFLYQLREIYDVTVQDQSLDVFRSDCIMSSMCPQTTCWTAPPSEGKRTHEVSLLIPAGR